MPFWHLPKCGKCQAGSGKCRKCHIQVDNARVLSYLLKIEETMNTALIQISKEKLRISAWAWNRSYHDSQSALQFRFPGTCSTYTKKSQLQWRLGVVAPERFLGMKTVSSNFQENMSNIGEKPRNRPVCFKVVKLASMLLLLEAGYQESWYICSSEEMVL